MVVNLHAVLLLEFQVFLVQSVDTVNHGLDKLDLGVSQSVLVGDVISVSGLATRFTTGATGLDSEFLAPLLQSWETLLGPSGEVNVDRGPHASTQVGGAGVDVAELLRQLEVLARLSLDTVLDSLDATGQPLEDTLDITTLLHGDDTSLILLIDPDQEGLSLVVEDATALGPVTLHTSNLQVPVARHEQEVVVNELLAHSLLHTGEGVVLASQVIGQLGQSRRHQLLNVNTLLLGDSGGQTEAVNVATDTDAGGVDGHLGVDVADNLLGVHVAGVLSIGADAMVLLDQGVEHVGEVLVGVPVTSIDTTVLVVELNSAGNGLGQGEAAGLGLDVLDGIPFLLGDVLGHEGVGGLDVGEFSGHCASCIQLYASATLVGVPCTLR